MAKNNILGTSSPLMRQVAIIIVREGASSIAAAKVALRGMNTGDAKFKRDLPAAFELAEQIRKRRRMRSERNACGSSTEWYGFHRRAEQTLSQSRMADERRALAVRLDRHINRRIADLPARIRSPYSAA